MHLFKTDFLTEICAEGLEIFSFKKKVSRIHGLKITQNILQVCLNTQSKKKKKIRKKINIL